MNKLKAVIQYECITSSKYVWVFYAIQYGVILLITAAVAFISGDMDRIAFSNLEINTLVYVSILGALGFHQDFKMLIQQGFTRRYIFIATVTMFCFISGIMALVDTLVGNVVIGRILHSINPNYVSLYGIIYGYDHPLMNWLWLLLFYTTVCCLLYLIVLVVNKAGKTTSIYLGACIGAVAILINALVKYVLSPETVKALGKFLLGAMGFLPDGTVNHLFPVLSFIMLAVVFGTGAYAVIRRTELI